MQLSDAEEKLRRAIGLRNGGDLDRALELYQSALAIFMELYRVETNVSKKASLLSIMDQYMGEAETVKSEIRSRQQAIALAAASGASSKSSSSGMGSTTIMSTIFGIGSSRTSSADTNPPASQGTPKMPPDFYDYTEEARLRKARKNADASNSNKGSETGTVSPTRPRPGRGSSTIVAGRGGRATTTGRNGVCRYFPVQ
jgi:hypothetical protein